MRSCFLLVFVVLFMGEIQLINAQNASEQELDALLDAALVMAEAENWEDALNLLEEAEQLFPENSRVEDYRDSIMDLQALTQAQESWEAGLPQSVAGESPGSNEALETEEPKFTINRDSSEVGADLEKNRDSLVVTAGITFLNVDTDVNSTQIFFKDLQEYLSTGLQLDLRYWFPFLGRRLGMGFRYDSFFWKVSHNTFAHYFADLDISFRGFLLESKNSRMEIGLNLGMSFVGFNAAGTRSFHVPVVLGLFFSDSLFFHLFDILLLEPLVLEGKLQLYTFLDTLTLDLVAYRLEVYWRFPSWRLGVRFDMNNFFREETMKSVWSLGLVIGYH